MRTRRRKSCDLVELLGRRLSAVKASKISGVAVTAVYDPVEGFWAAIFVGVTAISCRLDTVVGDVTGHGFDAALDAMRLQDLLLGLLDAGHAAVMPSTSPIHSVFEDHGFVLEPGEALVVFTDGRRTGPQVGSTPTASRGCFAAVGSTPSILPSDAPATSAARRHRPP